MGFFQTTDHEGELLERHFAARGLTGEALLAARKEAREALAAGKPLAYLIGEEAFFDLVFYVNEDVLVPRPDTERLLEKAIALLPQDGRFADLGTGSGCIAVTLLHKRPDSSGIALDISPGALAVAKENAGRAAVSERLTFLLGDMLADPLGEERFDLILSNPPYIPRKEIARYPSLAYEPVTALDGGEDGLDFYRHLLGHYRKNLKPSGGFLFEIGYDQREAIEALAKEAAYTCQVFRDYGGNDRVALLYPKE